MPPPNRPVRSRWRQPPGSPDQVFADAKDEAKQGAGRGGSSGHQTVGANKGSKVNVRRSTTSYPPGPQSNRGETAEAESYDGPADPKARTKIFLSSSL
jgi:hypothetical protein